MRPAEKLDRPVSKIERYRAFLPHFLRGHKQLLGNAHEFLDIQFRIDNGLYGASLYEPDGDSRQRISRDSLEPRGLRLDCFLRERQKTVTVPVERTLHSQSHPAVPDSRNPEFRNDSHPCWVSEPQHLLAKNRHQPLERIVDLLDIRSDLELGGVRQQPVEKCIGETFTALEVKAHETRARICALRNSPNGDRGEAALRRNLECCLKNLFSSYFFSELGSGHPVSLISRLFHSVGIEVFLHSLEPILSAEESHQTIEHCERM